jgi:hypothetical protein
MGELRKNEIANPQENIQGWANTAFEMWQQFSNQSKPEQSPAERAQSTFVEATANLPPSVRQCGQDFLRHITDGNFSLFVQMLQANENDLKKCLPALKRSLTHLGINLDIFSKEADPNNPKFMPDPDFANGIAFSLSGAGQHLKVTKNGGTLDISAAANDQFVLGPLPPNVDEAFKRLSGRP